MFRFANQGLVEVPLESHLNDDEINTVSSLRSYRRINNDDDIGIEITLEDRQSINSYTLAMQEEIELVFCVLHTLLTQFCV